ncbi:MAG: 50S ribosomal protein L17 [Caldisericia bacterium]|nr:50S ribosomal protein L17 [Caldisericia bacterium]
MRNRRKSRKLNFYSAQRKSVLRTMTVSLIMTETVNTTDARAKEVKKYAESLINLCKDDSLNNRRRAFSTLRDKDVVKKMFGPLHDRYQERDGGYIRIFHTGYRRGDAAKMCTLKLIN